MSDPLCMSLDDIIKQKRNRRKPQVVGVRGTRRGTLRAFKSSAGRGRVIWNFNRKNVGRGKSPVVGNVRRGNRYFNSLKNTSLMDWTAGRNRQNQGIRGVDGTRGRRNRAANNQFSSQAQYQFSVARGGRRGRGWSNNDTIPFDTFGRVNTQRNLRFAQKSITKARQMLIRRRILLNNRNRGNLNFTSAGTGRIRVGKFGLVTTRKQNLIQRQTIIQRKIQRARQLREQRQQGRLDNLGFTHPRNKRNFRQNRNPIDFDFESWSPRFAFNTRGGRSGSRSRQSPRGLFTEDNWIPPIMQVNNTSHDDRVDRGRVRPPRSGLDPNIQRKILYIQEQGRRSRGEQKPDIYDDVEDDPTEFRSTIITSRVSLSDRFKRFMN